MTAHPARFPSCVYCAKCAKACLSAIPVDRLITVKSADCMGCMQCVAICPAEGALFMSAPARRRVAAWAVAAGIVILFLGTYAFARCTSHPCRSFSIADRKTLTVRYRAKIESLDRHLREWVFNTFARWVIWRRAGIVRKMSACPGGLKMRANPRIPPW